MGKPLFQSIRGASARSCYRPISTTLAATLVLGCALLAACGQKGPLWVPGHPKDTPWPIMAPAKAGNPPVPADPGTGTGSGSGSGNGDAPPDKSSPSTAPAGTAPASPAAPAGKDGAAVAAPAAQ
jgi:predicted small lipoprotein YifL